jgi:ABC-2 type transport system ATP-binding protein
MEELAIEARGLRKVYGRNVAVKGLDLSVRPGEIFGLVGPDGAGKTSTLQMLCSLSTPSGGSARVLGHDTVRQGEAVKERIGYMSERFTLYAALTVGENLDFFARLRRVPRRLAAGRKRELLHFSRLEPFQDRQAQHLSGGMQKKLALCCCLIHEPAVIFLDEPTTGVDPLSRRDFWRILARFVSRGVTVVVSTPYMDEAERFQRVALIHQGEVVACDTPEALKAPLIGRLLEIRARPLEAAVALLRPQPEVREVQVFGDTVHVRVDDAPSSRPVLEGALRTAGLADAAARAIAPGLEDAFVSLLPASETERAPAPRAAAHPLSNGGPAIRVVELVKRFDQFTAVDGVNFEVRKGEIFGFLGPNGSGKTTTIRLLTGLMVPGAGLAEVLGRDMSRYPHLVRQQVGYMSQRFSLFPRLTVSENIEFYGRLYGLDRRQLKERKEWVIGMAGLKGKERALPADLSGGWKQRLALGCAIIHGPQVVFLDEPTAGVDPISRRFFWELIQELSREGTTLFITTHYLDEAEHCHRIGLMHQGRLIALGSPGELKAQAHGALLELTSPDYARALEALAGSALCRQVSFFGSKVHLVVDRAADALPGVRAVLGQAGLRVSSLEPIPFTLEDVFISLVEAQETAAPAGKGA